LKGERAVVLDDLVAFTSVSMQDFAPDRRNPLSLGISTRGLWTIERAQALCATYRDEVYAETINEDLASPAALASKGAQCTADVRVGRPLTMFEPCILIGRSASLRRCK
jgi:hypothetical protein